VSFLRITRLIGIIIIFLAVAMATSMFWAWWLGDPTSTLIAFGVSSAVTLGAGASAWWFGRDSRGTIFRREAIAVVAFVWILLGVFGGLPYLLDGTFTNPVDAYFEAISGFSTTGSTVLTNIEGISHAAHWWRALTHWLGGMGIIVLFVAIFPQLGVGGKLLFKTEAPGPITEGLRPKIRETSLALWWIYFTFTAIEAVLLYLFGPDAAAVQAKGLSPHAVMDWHNAIIHAMSTMATGGFSTLNNSIAGFASARVDAIITIFMVLAGINFSLYYMALRRNARTSLRDRELWMYLATILGATVLITVAVWGTGQGIEAAKHDGLLTSFRYTVFQVVGVVTSTGFGTDNFSLYPPVGQLLLVVLMFMGGMAGSTAGGMKVFRFLVMFKALRMGIHQAFRPARIHVVRINKRIIQPEVVQGVLTFLTLGLLCWIVGSLYLAARGIDIVTATTAVAATLFNIGPGLARVGSIENFGWMPTDVKALLSFCMILGRLEFYALLVLFVPSFWRE
jgi:trk system potassium uptake protein TrkH